MISKMMNVALRAHLAPFVGKRMEGFSLVNFGRIKHTVALDGAELLKMFNFIADNASKKVSRVQRNTEVRHEDGVPHVSGKAVEQRSLTQTIFHATWRRDIGQLELQDGNTRVLDALKYSEKKFFQRVSLEIYEVDSADEAKDIYDCFDSRESVKQGKHDVQSLFRAADVLSKMKSRRMLRCTSLVTPLKRLTKANSLKTLTPAALKEHEPTLVFTDAVLLSLEDIEANNPDHNVQNVFGGGELTGLMQFHAENLHLEDGPHMVALQMSVSDALGFAIQNDVGSRSMFTSFYEDYVAATAGLGRSGSKIVPVRAKHFKAALESFAQWLQAKGAMKMAPRARRAGAK